MNTYLVTYTHPAHNPLLANVQCFGLISAMSHNDAHVVAEKHASAALIPTFSELHSRFNGINLGVQAAHHILLTYVPRHAQPARDMGWLS